MSFETLLFQSIDRLFEKVLAPPAVESFVRSGSYRLRLCFAHESLADEFLPSFLCDEAGSADLQIGFLTSAEADLSHLIPHPQTEYRATATNASFAAWQPGELPVLYLLDRESSRALIWFAAGTAPDWLASRPGLPIMYAFSVDTPWIPLHAAGVGRNGRTWTPVDKVREALPICNPRGGPGAGDGAGQPLTRYATPSLDHHRRPALITRPSQGGSDPPLEDKEQHMHRATAEKR